MDYWAGKEIRAAQAQQHTEEMEQQHASEIQKAIKSSVIYGGLNKVPQCATETQSPEIILAKTDSVTAAFAYKQGKTAILNYASYREPGGMFLKGSKAQEEALCHSSTLYNVLRELKADYYAYNRQHTERSLYTNRAVYSPGIVFYSETSRVGEFGVLTCAAPNYSAAHK